MKWPWSKSSGDKSEGDFSKPSESNDVTGPTANPRLLEDLPPKFQDDVETSMKARKIARPSFSEGLKSITLDDFRNLHKIPCFREGIVTGLTVSAVVFGIMLTARSSLSRSVNWTVGSFALSSTAAWEQCRFKKRRSQKNAQMAKQVVNGPHTKGQDNGNQ